VCVRVDFLIFFLPEMVNKVEYIADIRIENGSSCDPDHVLPIPSLQPLRW